MSLAMIHDMFWTLATSSLWLAGAGAGTAQLEVRFRMGEVVTNPTESSVQVGIRPADSAELQVEYWRANAQALEAARLPPRQVEAGELAVFDLTHLEPGTSYRYRFLVRAADGVLEEPAPRPVGSFRTLHSDRGAEILFAYAADSHITERWLAAQCDDKSRSRRELEVFGRTLAHLEGLNPDFLIAGGDTFMTLSPALVSCGAWSDAGSGSARTRLQAERRYEIALSGELWGRLTPKIPFLCVLGNHDGEARFGDEVGSFGHFPDLREISRQARLCHLPDPCRIYDGASDGSL
jgi:hypothetical protein